MKDEEAIVLMSAATEPVKYTPKANMGKDIKVERNPQPSDKALV